MKIIPMALIAFLPLLGHAETWNVVSTRDGDTWKLDADSVKAVTVNGKAMKQAVVSARFKEVSEDLGKKYDEARTTDVYDCAARTSANREEVLSMAGAPVRTTSTPDDQLEFIDIFPNTASADLAKVICGK